MQKNVLEYLEHTADRFPDKLAFSDGEEDFTFSRLLRCAQGLGTALARVTERHNAPVCVLVQRSAASVAGLLGALYAGCFYVPLDSQMPLPRMEAILTRLDPAALLCPAGLEETAKTLSPRCPILELESAARTPPDPDLLARRRDRVLDIDPAYVIFTSGSTGIPKGIVICHRSVIDFTEWFVSAGGFTQEDVLANQAPFYFDLSVKDIYTALKTGATVHIIPQKLFLFPLPLVRFLEEKRVTALAWATSAFHLLAASGALEREAPTHLRTVLLGGEALQAKYLNRWRRALPQVRYVNLYGPTEVTVDCTWYPIERDFADHEAIPIGRPCPNKEIVLLDEQLRPVPPGQPGEICVRGMGLTRGYFGEWDKTRSALIQDPRNPHYPDLLYRTGDLAVMDGDGVLTFLSRRDGQIKHMGYRIELGEIETALTSLPQVEEAVCLFDRERDKILCVYSGEESPQVARQARSLLPRYMVPNLYHWRKALPHNPNGKIDRAALREEFLS